MPIQNNDLFLVSRNSTNYKIEARNLMTVQDTDLFLVRRGSTNYKVPASELRKYFGAEDFIVEIWGRGFANQTFTGNGGGSSATVINGGGGYTRLSMKIPFSYTLQIRPIYYAGGSSINTDTFNGSTTVTTVTNTGGAAAGIGINDTWLAIAGGGGLGGYSYSFFNSNVTINNNTPYYSASYSAGGSGTAGKGGYNVSNPTTVPGIGGNGSSNTTFSITNVAPGQNFIIGSGTIIGPGGGGIPPGPGGTSSVGGQGGGANIRIWYEKQILDGYLTSFPDVKMKYVDSADGINFSAAKVRITSRLTDNFVDYTTNQDVLVSNLISQLVG
jgi:hypothetical protein